MRIIALYLAANCCENGCNFAYMPTYFSNQTFVKLVLS